MSTPILHAGDRIHVALFGHSLRSCEEQLASLREAYDELEITVAYASFSISASGFAPPQIVAIIR